MPRKHNRKAVVSEAIRHTLPFSNVNKSKCYGCAFAGFGNVCLSSDGECLKIPPKVMEEGDAEANRRTNSKGTER